MDKVDQEYLNELLQTGGTTEQDKTIDVKVKDDGISIDEIQVRDCIKGEIAFCDMRHWKICLGLTICKL